MRRHLLRWIGPVLLCLAAGAAHPAADGASPWLARVNFYRATAALPPVAENRELSQDVAQHARYMVMHDRVEHSQDPRNRWATRAGAAAAAASNLAASTRLTEPDSWAIDMWMQAPFHALGILDPALTHVGFGIHREAKTRIQIAAGLDVVRGRRTAPASQSFPILWPADDATVPIGAHVAETPSPLTSCPGYDVPAGLPLIVQLGTGGAVPRVQGSWIVEDDVSIEHCLFHEGTYANPEPAQERLGRRILAARDAIVLVPRYPLRRGSTYRAVVLVHGQQIDWTFRIGDASPSRPILQPTSH